MEKDGESCGSSHGVGISGRSNRNNTAMAGKRAARARSGAACGSAPVGVESEAMESGRTATAELLRRWHAGDEAALADLMAKELPWMRYHVHRRLGPMLRRRGDTQDFVQDAMLAALRYGPRFVVADARQLRALLGRIVENVLRDAHERHTAGRRDIAREEPLPTDSVIDFTAAPRAATTPSEAASANEWRGLVRLALELLSPADREILLLRQWHELAFEAIGERLGLTANAAQMRFARALPRLVDKVRELQTGLVPELARAIEFPA
jgi:RNA polymerase sigma-70 factor (ECF subfamily)